MASRLHIGRRMKIALLLSLSLAACTTEPTATTETAGTSAPMTNLAATAEMSQTAATRVCPADLHLPTAEELTEIFGHCHPTTTGWECQPCKASEGCVDRYGDDDLLLGGRIWSSTQCKVGAGGGAGYYGADFTTGVIACMNLDATAFPLCVR